MEQSSPSGTLIYSTCHREKVYKKLEEMKVRDWDNKTLRKWAFLNGVAEALHTINLRR